MSLFAMGSAKTEVTQAQLTDMINQQRYVFHVDMPSNPPREVKVIFDLTGLHIFDQSKEITSRG